MAAVCGARNGYSITSGDGVQSDQRMVIGESNSCSPFADHTPKPLPGLHDQLIASTRQRRRRDDGKAGGC